MKKITLLLLMLVSHSGFAQFPSPYCGPIAFTSGVEPITLVNFAGINNTSTNLVGVANGNTIIAHENYTAVTGNVTAGISYPITLKGNTDGSFTNRFMVFADWNQDGDFADADEAYTITQTINSSTGLDAIQSTQFLLVPATALVGTTRMRVKKIYGTTAYVDPCLGTGYGQVEDYSLTVVPLPADLPDYANLQSPNTASIIQGGSVTVYGQVYEEGLTNSTQGQAPGIQAWVGYGTTDVNPNTFTNWIPATFNVEVGNNDEYQANLGAGLAVGTYYYATRFQLNGGAFVYGGANNGFWNGTDNINGVLTVTTPPPPANDNFATPIAISCGNTYSGNTSSQVTLDENDAPDGFGAALTSPNLWYSFTGSGSAETVILDLCNSGFDTTVMVFTGTSGNLTLVSANDDDSSCTLGSRSKVNFTSDGTITYYISVSGYNTATGTFTMNVSCAAVTPPAVDNQDCDSALNVQVDGSDNNSDNSFGTVSSTQPSCDTFGSIQDVWFSFVAPTSSNVTCLVTRTTMTSLNFNIYAGSCGALTAVTATCNSNLTVATSEVLTGLTPGNTYFVQVWSNSAEQGTFALRLSDNGLGNSSFDSSNFTYYPNPVKNTLNLSYNQEISNVDVFNLLGQKVSSNKINANDAQIDMSNLSKGAYMVRVTSNDQVKTVKVIKE